MAALHQLPDFTDRKAVTAWLNAVANAVDTRATALRRFGEYYDGVHRLSFSTPRFRSAFGQMFDEFRDNWCDLVVDAVEERCNLEGFRIGKSNTADESAWGIWQREGFDAESSIGHTEAFIYGRCPVSVLPDESQADRPRLRLESPLQTIVLRDPSEPLRRIAGVKVWTVENARFATIYDAAEVRRFTSPSTGTDWQLRDDPGGPHRGDDVPMLELVNRPRLLRRHGASELVNVIPLQDAVNKLVADMLVASEFGAVRQRWATGLELEEDEAGVPKAPFKVAADTLWTTEGKEVKFGDFDTTDLANFATAIELVVQHIASQSRTPPHYFYLSGQFPSGESIKSAEAGLVGKARRRARHFGQTWEDAIRLALAIAGEPVDAATPIETIWGDFENRTDSELADAMTKHKALGVPDEAIWHRLGYSAAEVSRFRALRSADALRSRLAGQPPAPPEPGPTGPVPPTAPPAPTEPVPAG